MGNVIHNWRDSRLPQQAAFAIKYTERSREIDEACIKWIEISTVLFNAIYCCNSVYNFRAAHTEHKAPGSPVPSSKLTNSGSGIRWPLRQDRRPPARSTPFLPTNPPKVHAQREPGRYRDSMPIERRAKSFSLC